MTAPVGDLSARLARAEQAVAAVAAAPVRFVPAALLEALTCSGSWAPGTGGPCSYDDDRSPVRHLVAR